jgi:hypothetical protein
MIPTTIQETESVVRRLVVPAKKIGLHGWRITKGVAERVTDKGSEGQRANCGGNGWSSKATARPRSAGFVKATIA